jgi:apolipoprotein N-acyltransferase
MLVIVWFFPFMVDRLIYPKLKNHKKLATLTFPIINTALLFLITFEGPFDDGSGTTNSFGYSFGSLAFMQVRSLFGIWILIFVHSWLYAIANYFWENNFKWNKIKRLVIIYPSVIALIFVFGLIKTRFEFKTNSKTVKIAAVVLFPEDGNSVRMSTFFDSKKTSSFDKTIYRIENMIQAASKKGAKIVSFQEYAILINQEDEDKLKRVLTGFAKENNVYLSTTYAFYGIKGKGENKQILISPYGKIELEYTKRFLLGIGSFGECGVFRKGEEKIQSLETPYGKLAISICRDAGFPKFMRQAAKEGVDIMLSPSYDWPKSHSAWYLTCAVENGFSFVRPTYNGYSYAADYNGKELAYMKSDDTKDGIMYADVPTQGIKTLYAIIGDFFGWLNVVGVMILIFYAIKKRTIALQKVYY